MEELLREERLRLDARRLKRYGAVDYAIGDKLAPADLRPLAERAKVYAMVLILHYSEFDGGRLCVRFEDAAVLREGGKHEAHRQS